TIRGIAFSRNRRHAERGRSLHRCHSTPEPTMARARWFVLQVLVPLVVVVSPVLSPGTSSLLAQAMKASQPTKSPRQEGLPLEVGRTLSLTVREGSWMSVDVSPDGSTIVFDLLGDLYTVPITGGKATPLTRGMAFDAQPRFSPDGRRVVFTSDRDGAENVWILSLDLKDTVQVTKGKDASYQSPEWTPDGEYIVVTRQGGGAQGKLWLYHVEGGTGIQLIREPASLRTTGAAFGADPREIWFARRTGGWQYNSPMRDYQLAVFDRETGKIRTESFRYGSA